MLAGRRAVVARQPSKLNRGVRFPRPAPRCPDLPGRTATANRRGAVQLRVGALATVAAITRRPRTPCGGIATGKSWWVTAVERDDGQPDPGGLDAKRGASATCLSHRGDAPARGSGSEPPKLATAVRVRPGAPQRPRRRGRPLHKRLGEGSSPSAATDDAGASRSA